MNNNDNKFTDSEARLIDRLGCAGIIFIFILTELQTVRKAMIGSSPLSLLFFVFK